MSHDADFWLHLQPEIAWIHVQLRRLGVPSRDLDDVTQAVLLHVHARWEQYDRARLLRPWLMGFSVRLAANHRRLVARRREDLGVVDDQREFMVDPTSPLDDHARSLDARALVAAALDALDGDRRAVLVMIDLEDMSPADVAHALEVPLNTAYSRLRLARQDFAAAVQRIQLRQRGT